MKLLRILILALSSMPLLAFSYVDLSLNYSYSKQVYVDSTVLDEQNNKSTTITKGASVVWAWYIWEYTALELNYSQTQSILLDVRDRVVDSVTFFSIEQNVQTVVSGAGIRQSFAGREARIIPSLSIGYAKMVQSGKTKYDVDTGSGRQDIELENETTTSNSGYAAFSLRFRITQFLGLNLAAKTVMPEFNTSLAENNVSYAAGLSWVF